MTTFVAYTPEGRVVGRGTHINKTEYDRTLPAGAQSIAAPDGPLPENIYVAFTPDPEILEAQECPITVTGTTLSGVPFPANVSAAGALIGQATEATAELAFDEPGRYIIVVEPDDVSYVEWVGVVDAT